MAEPRPVELDLGTGVFLRWAVPVSSSFTPWCSRTPARRLPGALLLALLCVVAAPVEAGAQQLVFLVRHAERADGGAPPAGMQGPADPELSAEGRARAERLAAMLAGAGVTRIIVSEFRRTLQTAEPLAKQLGFPPDRVPAADVAGLATRLGAARDDVVLIVGHSNSVPAIIAALGGPALTIAETDYGNLFVFVPASRTLSRLRY
jgi:phosphohistidine phosphatase SixA